MRVLIPIRSNRPDAAMAAPGSTDSVSRSPDRYRNDQVAVFQYEPNKSGDVVATKLAPFVGAAIHRPSRPLPDGRRFAHPAPATVAQATNVSRSVLRDASQLEANLEGIMRDWTGPNRCGRCQ